MRVGVPKEISPGENRVALVPETVSKLVTSGMEVFVESRAGEGSFYFDNSYKDAGAIIVPDAVALYGSSDVVLKVQKPIRTSSGKHEVELMKSGCTLVTFLQPLVNHDIVRLLIEKRIISFSMDMIPRTTRAQKMDALSSMATIAGYKAVLLGASNIGKFFPMLTTAAGTIPPARAFILGAGVAGLQAIATARRLGAVVEAFDTRPAVKEQVQSLGATFVDLWLETKEEELEDSGGYAMELSDDLHRKEQELIAKHVKDADIIITTAQIPGKPAPKLITEEMVKVMKPGSVIIDLAGESGGNCTLTKPGEAIQCHNVFIHAPLNLPSAMPVHASQMYSRNISSLLTYIVKDNKLNLNMDDEIIQGSCITHEGHIINKAVQALLATSATSL